MSTEYEARKPTTVCPFTLVIAVCECLYIYVFVHADITNRKWYENA